MTPRPIVIESPYAGPDKLKIAANVLYAQRCLDDSLRRDEAPFASHLLYPQVLDDEVPSERRAGIDAQLAWIDSAACVAFYIDRGISDGMLEAMKHARRLGHKMLARTIRQEPDHGPDLGDVQAALAPVLAELEAIAGPLKLAVTGTGELELRYG